MNRELRANRTDILYSIIVFTCAIAMSCACASALDITLKQTAGVYPASGTWTTRFDSGGYTWWRNVTWVSDKPAGTNTTFRVRSAPDNESLGSANWSSYLSASGQPFDIPDNQWLELEINLTTNNPSITPKVMNLSMDYNVWYPPIQTENDGFLKTELYNYIRSNISGVFNYTWDRNGKARIRFGNVNLSGIDNLDNIIEVGHRFVFVNSGSYRNLNKSSDITFYNIDCLDPNATRIYYSESGYTLDEILGSGRLCGDLCTNVQCVGGEDGNLSFTVAHFTGYAVGGNANLTIYDDIEESGIRYLGENITFFANYTNSGTHISGASCNISFEDEPGVWYEMIESSLNYNYTKSNFSEVGTYVWNVTCDHPSYSQLETSDTVLISGSGNIPEFAFSGIILGSIIALSGVMVLRRRKQVKTDE